MDRKNFKRLFGVVFIIISVLHIGCKKNDTKNSDKKANGTGALSNPSNAAFIQAPSISGGGTRPSSYDLTQKMPPVDPTGQGSQNSCVAWALAYAAYSYYHHKVNNTNFYSGTQINRSSVFSPTFIYNQINNGVDKGSNFWDAINLMKNSGVATWNSMPYNITDFTTQPNNQQLADAANHKIAYGFIIEPINDANITKIKDYVSTDNPVVIRVLPDDNMANFSNTDTIWSSIGQNQGTFGHAMIIVGYDDAKGAFKVQNSYGTSYKAKGFLWITYSNLKVVSTEAYVIKPSATNTVTKIINITGTLNFGNINVGSTSNQQFTITNTGNTALNISSINAPTGYTLNWTSGTIQSNGTQIISVTFNPTTTQNYNGSITVNSDATGGTNTIQVTGTGTQVAQTRIISLSGNLSFGNVGVNSNSTLNFTISNTGNSALVISSITCPQGFSASWSGTIQSNNSISVPVTFTPTNAQSYSGNIVVNSNATSGANTINTNGTGIINSPTSNPTANTYTTCPVNNITGSGLCVGSTYLGNTINFRILSPITVSGGHLNFEIKKCAGGTFSNSGTAYIKEGDYCGTIIGTSTYNVGTSIISIQATPQSMTGTKTYTCVLVSATTDKYHGGQITVTY
jgi:C1A family cysteine protease